MLLKGHKFDAVIGTQTRAIGNEDVNARVSDSGAISQSPI